MQGCTVDFSSFCLGTMHIWRSRRLSPISIKGKAQCKTAAWGAGMHTCQGVLRVQVHP